MAFWRKAILYGVLLWATAFLAAFAIFSLRETNRPLFESIMPVVLTGATAVLGYRYLAPIQGRLVREGFLLGLLWMGINIGIDLPLMLSSSPMGMTLTQYLSDIGVTYFVIPIVTTATGFALRRSIEQ